MRRRSRDVERGPAVGVPGSNVVTVAVGVALAVSQHGHSGKQVRRRSHDVEQGRVVEVPGSNAVVVAVGVALAVLPRTRSHSERRLSGCAGGPAMLSEDTSLGSLMATRSQSQSGWRLPFHHAARVPPPRRCRRQR